MSRSILLIGFAALLLLAWLGRYDIEPLALFDIEDEFDARAVRLDRWTGSVALCRPTICETVEAYR